MFSFTSALPYLFFPPSLFANLTCLHCPCSVFHAKKQLKLPPLRFSVNKESSGVFLDGKKNSWGRGSGFLRRCIKDWGSEGDLALEAEILEFMETSKNPEAFPSKKELIDAGRMDLAEAILKQGGWLASGWDLDGGDWEDDNIDLGLSRRDREREWSNAVAQNRNLEGNDVGKYEEVDFSRSISSPTASSSGKSLGTAAKDDSGIEGILNRLEKERNINFGFGLREKENGTPVQTSEPEHDWLAENSNHVTVADIKKEDRPPSVNFKHSAINDSGDKLVNSRSISNTDSFQISFKPDMWRAWSIHRAGFSDMEFEAGEISSNATRTEGEMDASGDEKLIMREGADASLNGRKQSFHGGVSHDQIRSRLQLLELELSSVLHRLQSNTSEIGSEKGDEYSSADFLRLSDAWEFQENEIMNAQDKLRSIRAKLAVLEGKMALAVMYAELCLSNRTHFHLCYLLKSRSYDSDAQKMVEEKQKRIDDARRALRLLRSACIVWPNAAIEVLLAGSFDGWTTQRKMEKSDTGVFSLYLKLYPGRYEIKFIVDGVWRIDPLRPIVHNNGYENNLLIIT